MFSNFMRLMFICFICLSCAKEELPTLDEEAALEYDIRKRLQENSGLRDKLIDLTHKAETNNYESGYLVTLSKDKRTAEYVEIFGDPRTPSLSFSLSKPIDGLLHNHYGGLFPIFSCSDLRVIYEICDAKLMNDSKDFHAVIVSTEKIAYAIGIDDKDRFLEFGNMFLGNVLNFRQIEKSFFDLQKDYRNSHDYVYSFELAFFNVLFRQEQTTGLNVYRSNYPFNEWYIINIDKENNKLYYDRL